MMFLLDSLRVFIWLVLCAAFIGVSAWLIVPIASYSFDASMYAASRARQINAMLGGLGLTVTVLFIAAVAGTIYSDFFK
jgi:L-asparagine transporter-like permease